MRSGKHVYNVARTYNSATTQADILLLWHKKLGHRNEEDVVAIANEWGIPLRLPRKPLYCDACVQAKSTRAPVATTLAVKHPAPRPGYILHSDSCGKFAIPTRSGYEMFNIIVDGVSRRIWLRLDKSQSNFYEHLVDVVVELEAGFGHAQVVARLQTGGHDAILRDQRVGALCRLRGIKPSACAPFAPNCNALSKRTIRTICEMASAMIMTSANAPPSVCGEAVMHAVWLLNFELPYKAGAVTTRDEILTGREGRRSLDRVLPWGCVVWAHEHVGGAKAIGKAKARKCVYLRYDEHRSCIRLGVDHARKVIFSGHVIPKEPEGR